MDYSLTACAFGGISGDGACYVGDRIGGEIVARIKKANAIFGKYPCCDLLNRALRFILDGKPDLAKDDIVHAIYKADGYFYEDVAERLGIEPKE